MPRTSRYIPPQDAALHIMTRGNNHQCLFNSDEDKIRYLLLLRRLKDENNLDIFHYCLMNTHVHLIVWLRKNSCLSKFMKQINLCYYNYYNKIYGYAGHLCQGRFKSNVIDTDRYLLQCGKYIELNPVRANMVNSPEAYRFSSYNYYAFGIPDSIISPSPTYSEISPKEELRRKHYIKFVLDSSMVNSKILDTQLFIGNDAFIAKQEERFKVKNISLVRGRPRKHMEPEGPEK